MTTAAASPLLTAPIGPALTRLSLPAILAMFIQTIMSAAEAWFLGRVGPVALAGAALVFPMLMLVGMLANGALGGAVAGATARALGAGDIAKAEAVLRQAILLSVCGAVVSAVVFLGFGRPIFAALGGHGPVLAAALDYTAVLFAGSGLIWAAGLLSSVVRGCGRMAFSAKVIGLVTAVHVPLAGLFILGAGPIPAMGMTGAALAQLCAYGAGTAWLLADLAWGNGPVKLRLGPGGGMKEILGSGIVGLISPLLSVGAILMLTALAGRLGPVALAGYGIGARLEFMMIPIIFGIGSAMIAMVGANVGAGQHARAVNIAWRGTLAASLLVGGIGAVLAIFPDLWATLFTDEPAIVEATRAYLRVVGPFYWLFGLGLASFFASFALKTVIWPVLGGVLRLAIIAAGGLWLTQGDMTLNGLFWVIAVAMACYGGFTATALWLGPWRPQATSIGATS
ncbi:MAG: MATE family efflux transporter [Alphaproteobacteria bacterium]